MRKSHEGTEVSILRKLLPAFLPQDCLLCGAPSGDTLLCTACVADLPRLLADRCPVCAEASPNGMRCGACLNEPPHYDATFATLRYAFPVDRLIHELKYRSRIATADFLAAGMLAGPRPAGDVIVPVPLSPIRLRERGFNQSVEIARPLARALKLSIATAACERHRHTTPQAVLPWKERRRNIRQAFSCRMSLSGQTVIVVDDVMTSGATLDELARTLKAHGAKTVINWVAARTIRE